MEKVAVILINYNGKKYNDACIASVLESKGVDTRAIVVDNASTDDSLMLLTEKWGDNPRVSIILIFNFLCAIIWKKIQKKYERKYGIFRRKQCRNTSGA